MERDERTTKAVRSFAPEETYRTIDSLTPHTLYQFIVAVVVHDGDSLFYEFGQAESNEIEVFLPGEWKVLCQLWLAW